MQTKRTDTTDSESARRANVDRENREAREAFAARWKLRSAKAGFLLLLIIAAGGIFLTVQAELDRPSDSGTQVAGTTEWRIVVDGQNYRYKVTYGKSYQLVDTEGDPWITSHAGTQNCTDAKQLKRYLHTFVDQEGGTMKVVDQSGLKL